jgi:hypothetical protein
MYCDLGVNSDGGLKLSDLLIYLLNIFIRRIGPYMS